MKVQSINPQGTSPSEIVGNLNEWLPNIRGMIVATISKEGEWHVAACDTSVMEVIYFCELLKHDYIQMIGDDECGQPSSA